MRIVVTGGTGFIGSHMIARLRGEGHEVRCVDIKHDTLRSQWYAHANEVLIGDLRDPGFAAEAVRGAELVFMFANDMGGVGYFFSDADAKASVNNIRIDLNTLQACRDQHVPRVFYASSFCAYPITDQRHGPDGKALRAMSETDLGGGPAEQLYGEEKRFVTLLAPKLDLDVRVGLFSTIFGPGQESEGIRSKFPTAITRRVLESDGGPIELWGDGTQVRTFLWIDDALERICRVAFADRYDGPVNVGSDEQVTIRECAEWVCEMARHRPWFRLSLDKPTGVLAKDTDNTAFVKRYGDVGQTPCREGFRRLFDWMCPPSAGEAEAA